MANEYKEWYHKTFSAIIGLDKAVKYATNKKLTYLQNAISNFQFRFSSLWRYETLANMRYLAPVKKLGYITTTFKISRKKHSAIYGFLYSSIQSGKFVHEFVCHSPTYVSADGEYRHRFIPYKQLLYVKSTNNMFFETVEKHILEQVSKEECAIECQIFYESSLEGFEDQLKNDGMASLIYAASWSMEFLKYKKGTSENHLFGEYNSAMFSSSDEQLYKKLSVLPLQEVMTRSMRLKCILPDPRQKNLITECGQKIIPIPIKTLENPKDIRITIWREIFITSRVCDLVINGISPSFPIINDWFFITGANSSLYDNKIYQVRAQHSDVAINILKGLESSRRKAYVKEIPLSYKMEKLAESIENPMNFAEQELILSKYAICSTIEHVGRTLVDLPKLLQREDFRITTGPIFADFSYFCKYIFEVIYGLWCVNSFLGVIHGDLHMNNLTTFNQISTTVLNDVTNIRAENPHILYQVQNDFYVFPHRGRFMIIIDFSRGFIWNKKILAEEFKDPESVEHDYKQRILQLFQRELPEFTKTHETELIYAIKKNFDAVYRVAEGLDIYKFVNEFAANIELSVLGDPSNLKQYGDKKELEGQMIPLLQNIRKHIHSFIKDKMAQIFKNPEIPLGQIPRPNLELLQKFFQKFRADSQQGVMKLIDFFSDQNTIRYNCRKYENFPEIIKFDKVNELKLTMDQARQTIHNDYKKYIAKHPQEKAIDKVVKEAIIEKKIIREPDKKN
jgi:hypothetical protein